MPRVERSDAARAARAELAGVVARVREAEAGAEALERAASDASRAVWAAEARVEAARRAVDAARNDAATHLQAVALGTAGEAPRSIREARDALRDAEDDLAAAAEARDVAALQRELVRKSLALSLLTRGGALPCRSEPGLANMLADETAQGAVRRLGSPPDSWRELRGECGDLAALWSAAIAALRTDAAAPLPAGGG